LLALIAAVCAWNVVDTMGQPFPGPLRFCSVMLAAVSRASCDCFELSVGKVTFTDGLFTAKPAITSATRCCKAGAVNFALRD
jgi:hypothetical protein